MRLSARELYNKIIAYGLVGEKGEINFSLKDFSIKITSRDTVGNLVQDWLIAWMMKEGVEFEINDNSQIFPDIYLNKHNKKTDLLEIKTFDTDRGAGFDLANFESYCNSLTTDAYRLDSDYLIIGYKMYKHEITVKDIWLKKIWEISGGSGPYPVKVQDKKKIIYNLRPVNWYSERSKYKPFNSLEEFLYALNETRYKYPKTHYENARWLSDVLRNYEEATGVLLKVS